MELTQRLVEERGNCVCTEMQKNVALRHEFSDLLENLNKPF